MDKKYFVYKTTNLINEKIYIGVHSTYNLDDGYLGSGIYLKKSILKYGIHNFKREILEFFDSEKLAFQKEREIVTEDFILKTSNYNLSVGGKGGYKNISKDGIKRISESRKNKVVAIKNGKKLSISKEEFDSNSTIFGHTKNRVTVKDKNGSFFQISINDKRYKSGELVPVTKNLVTAISKNTGQTIMVSQNEFQNSDDLVGITFGSKQTTTSNTKRSLSLKGKPKPQKYVKCSYCKKVGGVSNMKRWHFENCKESPNFNLEQHNKKTKRLFNNDKYLN